MGHSGNVKLSARLYQILEMTPQGGKAGRIFNGSIIVLIIANVAAIVAESERTISVRWGGEFRAFEVFSVLVFTVEYLLRVYASVENPAYGTRILGRLRYMISPMALVDLVAIMPFYMPFAITIDLRAVRVLRLFRLFRVLKLGRYSSSVRFLRDVIVSKREELVLSLSMVAVLLVLSSSLMFYAEHDRQPGTFSSIPAAMWWAVCTLTTVGYGDVYPVTAVGKVLSACISILGIGLFALPAGILAAGCSEVLRARADGDKCPTCGRALKQFKG